MAIDGIPTIDVVVLSRRPEPLHPEVESSLRCQKGVQLIVHGIVGQPGPNDSCRIETIARARNEGKLCGGAPWLMFVDDDVVLEPNCILSLVEDLSRRPVFAALAADYLGERQEGEISRHVAMGATLFRREALEQVFFRGSDDRCECQCCCDDLRRLFWGIDYCSTAKARHLPREAVSEDVSSSHAVPVNGSPNVSSADASARRAPSRTPTVCLVACYFGPLPGWIEHYLLSCAHNPSIDFLIITDQQTFPAAPPNVRVLGLSLADFNRLATIKTGVQISLSHPRKFCDFKPLYGHLFEDYLKGWDYWGYTDLDVVYGNIRRVLSAAKLEDYDVFTARREFLVGHFSMFRNDDRMRMLYRESGDVLRTITSPHVLSFDECGQQWDRRLRGEPLNGDATCESMTHVVHRLISENRISARFEPAVIEWPEIGDRGWRLRWQNGRLWSLNEQREVMYFHFHAFKDQVGYSQPISVEPHAAFEISPEGFSTAVDGPPTGPPAPQWDHIESASAVPLSADRSETPAPLVLTAFDPRHLDLFYGRFLASLRMAGNNETVVPVALGLNDAEREQLARVEGVRPVFCGETGEHVARSRLRLFAEVTRALPPETPIAYWDAGDVIFQSQLEPLWDLVCAHPNQLLAAREPSGYPENPVVQMWTNGITDDEARHHAQRMLFHGPFLNAGFLAGTAGALTRYFETAARWYHSRELTGTNDLCDQTALNLYCHSSPHLWHEIPESWNYCLWGRTTCCRREDGAYIDTRGVPIHVVHGNAHTLDSVPFFNSTAFASQPPLTVYGF
jgi:hypothetical protein